MHVILSMVIDLLHVPGQKSVFRSEFSYVHGHDLLPAGVFGVAQRAGPAGGDHSDQLGGPAGGGAAGL